MVRSGGRAIVLADRRVRVEVFPALYVLLLDQRPVLGHGLLQLVKDSHLNLVSIEC